MPSGATFEIIFEGNSEGFAVEYKEEHVVLYLGGHGPNVKVIHEDEIIMDE